MYSRHGAQTEATHTVMEKVAPSEMSMKYILHELEPTEAVYTCGR